jgi:hypothetical protein
MSDSEARNDFYFFANMAFHYGSMEVYPLSLLFCSLIYQKEDSKELLLMHIQLYTQPHGGVDHLYFARSTPTPRKGAIILSLMSGVYEVSTMCTKVLAAFRI